MDAGLKTRLGEWVARTWFFFRNVYRASWLGFEWLKRPYNPTYVMAEKRTPLQVLAHCHNSRKNKGLCIVWPRTAVEGVDSWLRYQRKEACGSNWRTDAIEEAMLLLRRSCVEYVIM
jgi:hypothetical protein